MIDVKQFSSDKILSHIDRVYEWLDSDQSRPITYELDMTNVCNSDCSFCFGFYKRKETPATLNKQMVFDIISQIKNFGGRGITFTGGGEPLCVEETLEVVEYAKELGMDIGFISNGLLLNEVKADKLVKNCTWIRLSLDAGSPGIYKKTHGLDSASFEKVLENTEALVKAKKKTNAAVTIGLGYLTPPICMEDMRDFVLLSRKLEVDYAQFRPVLKRFGEKRIDFDTKETIDYIRNLHDKYSDENTRVLFSKHKYEEISNGHSVRPYEKCYGHHFAAVIGADAKVYLCCHTRGIEKYCLGNLSEKSLKEIWHSQRRKEVYENIDFSDCPYLCRCDSFNTILWHIKKEKVHKNFL